MAKTAKPATPLTGDNPMVSAMRMPTPMPWAGPHMRHFWVAQDQFLKEMQDFSEGWFARRHTGTQAALSTASQMDDRAQAPDAWRDLIDWQTHSIERVMEDWQAFFAAMARCGEIAVRNEVEAAHETAQAAGKAQKPTKATPV